MKRSVPTIFKSSFPS